MVHEHRPAANPVEDARLTGDHGADVVIVPHAECDDLGAPGGLRRGSGPATAVLVTPALRFFRCPVVHADLVSRGGQVSCHGVAHDA